MTVSTTISQKDYAGDGFTTLFPTTFKFLANADLTVTLRDALNVETLLVETTHYTLTGAGADVGGDVTMITPPASGEVLVLLRATAKTQGTDYVANDDFPAEVHEEALDRLTLIAQEISDVGANAITAPVSDTAPNLELPVDVDRANEFLVFDVNGDVQTSAGTGADAGLRADLASVASGQGASLLGVLDSAGNFVGTDLETILADLAAGKLTRDFIANNLTLNGNVLNPGLPAFSASPSAVITNIGVGGDTDLKPLSEVFDQGGDLNATTGVFTAPVAGRYRFDVGVRLDQLDTAAASYTVFIVTTSKTFEQRIEPLFTADMNWFPMSLSVLADMAAGDTAVARVVQVGGTGQTDIDTTSYFSGNLVA